MATTKEILRKAEHQCQSRGSRLTSKRKKVLESLLDSGKALSAYELADVFQSRFKEKIPPMSIYRILNFLQGELLVHKLRLANKFVACSHIACSHEHEIPQFLICGNCQSVREFRISQSIISSLQDNVKKAGFHMISNQLEIDCLCANCHSEVA